VQGGVDIPVLVPNEMCDDCGGLFPIDRDVVDSDFLVFGSHKKQLACTVDTLAELDVVNAGRVLQCMYHGHILEVSSESEHMSTRCNYTVL
jgi:hypothetical protein